MKQILTIAALAAIAIGFTGCGGLSDMAKNGKLQVGHTSTIHGGFGKVGIPLGSYGSLGIMGGVGYETESDFINPTGTNVTSSSIGLVTHSRNKQNLAGLGGGSSTNSASGAVVEGSDDSMVFFAGPATINDASTNRNTNASGAK